MTLKNQRPSRHSLRMMRPILPSSKGSRPISSPLSGISGIAASYAASYAESVYNRCDRARKYCGAVSPALLRGCAGVSFWAGFLRMRLHIGSYLRFPQIHLCAGEHRHLGELAAFDATVEPIARVPVLHHGLSNPDEALFLRCAHDQFP